MILVNKPKEALRLDMMAGGEVYESVHDEMTRMMQSHFAVTHAPQARYDETHLNNALLMGGVFNVYASGCVGAAKKACGRTKGLADLTSEMRLPSDEWVRKRFAAMQSAESLNALDGEVNRALVTLRDAGLDLVKWDLAIDMHLIPRYDKKPNPNLIKSREKNGTMLFERYITIQSIVSGVRLVLGAFLMPALADTGDFVGMLIAKVMSHGINIGVVMADREFFSVRVLEQFERTGTRYLMPCRNTDGVVHAIGEFSRGIRSKISDLLLTGRNEQIKYTAIITRRRKKGSKHGDLDVFDYEPDEPPHHTYIAFATNDPTINVEEYARRWGIETGYRQIEAARPRTRSENQGARTFCFFYGVMLYNAWVLLNVMDVVQDKTKFEKWDGRPEITQLEMKMYILFYVILSVTDATTAKMEHAAQALQALPKRHAGSIDRNVKIIRGNMKNIISFGNMM